jgi:hypothetical protein
MDLKNSLTQPWTTAHKLDLFECRVEVWTLGVMIAMLREIDAASKPSIWQHAAYGMLSVSFAYFEMIGKTLNPASRMRGTSSEDFNFGFCDVYPAFAPANGLYKDKIPNQPGTTGKELPNPDVQPIREFRDRIRNGLYHVGYTKSGLWIHNEKGSTDFETKTEPDPGNATLTIIKYCVNPHLMTRTIVDHFPKFMALVRTSGALTKKFEEYFDDFLSA